MAFLNFVKKREGLPDDIDLDMPPEPPKMMEEEFSTEEPIDEELMPVNIKKGKTKAKKEEKQRIEEDELPELPPLPEDDELESLPELEEENLPPLPDETFDELKGFDLPPPPDIGRKKKGLFSFLKPKKAAGLYLPKAGEEFPEMPPLPEFEEEKKFSEIPPIEEIPSMPEFEEELPLNSQLAERFKPQEEALVEEEAEPVEEVKQAKKAVRETVKKQKFITINNFKQIQNDISNTRGILRGIDELSSGFEEMKSDGDKEYVKLYNSLQDIQRKIMFVDKSLFREEV